MSGRIEAFKTGRCWPVLKLSFRKTVRWAALMIWSAAVSLPLSSGQAPQQDLERLLDRLTEKTKVSLEYKSWRASVVSTITKMDKNWNPEEVMLVTRNVGSSGEGEPREEILKVQQTKKGKTTDITQKYAAERQKEREKARRRRAEEKDASAGGRRGGGAMSLDEFLPFSKSKRQDFEFRLQEPSASGGPAVSVLEVRARVKNPRNWEGTFTFNPETYDLIGLDLRPSQNPKMVKELAMQIEFESLDNGFLALKRTMFKVNGGLFIKHVRQVVEDVYSDFAVLDKQN